MLDQFPKEFSQSSLVIGNPTTPNPKEALKFSEREAKEVVASILETSEEDVLVQKDASKVNVIKKISKAQWIHLACHGEMSKKLDPHSIFEGLLKLAPDEKHPEGYLYTQEITSLNLCANLVFLSACFSGRGNPQQEGTIGPVWSFLAAGALSTIATYWRLPDGELTLEIVKTFYSHLLGIGTKKLNLHKDLEK